MLLQQYVLPLVFLLMRRALWIVGQASEVTLHERELEVISDSLSTLADAVYDRVRTLQGMLAFYSFGTLLIPTRAFCLRSRPSSYVQAAKSERKRSTEQVLLWIGSYSCKAPHPVTQLCTDSVVYSTDTPSRKRSSGPTGCETRPQMHSRSPKI